MSRCQFGTVRGLNVGRRSGSVSGKHSNRLQATSSLAALRALVHSPLLNGLEGSRVLRDRRLHPKAVHSEFQHALKAGEFVITSFANQERE